MKSKLIKSLNNINPLSFFNIRRYRIHFTISFRAKKYSWWRVNSVMHCFRNFIKLIIDVFQNCINFQKLRFYWRWKWLISCESLHACQILYSQLSIWRPTILEYPMKLYYAHKFNWSIRNFQPKVARYHQFPKSLRYDVWFIYLRKGLKLITIFLLTRRKWG